MKLINLNLILVTTMLLPLVLKAQDHNEDLVLFEQGNALYSLVMDFDNEIMQLDSSLFEDSIKLVILQEQKEEIMDGCLEYFEELIEEYPKSELRYRSMNNAALISRRLDDMEEAIKYNKWIIHSKANDLEKGGIGEGIMAEPYALYKNRACKNIAAIYLEQEEYSKALKYLKLTKKYPYQHFCGNEHASNDLYMAQFYAKCYLELGDVKKALEHSLPHIFYNGLANNSQIVELSISILNTHYDKETLILDFKESIDKHYAELIKGDDYEWEKYFIDFMDVKIEIHYASIFGFEKEGEIEKAIEDSLFFQLLNAQ